MNDRLENIHYFPDEQPFQEPFTEIDKKDPYQLVENDGTAETMKHYPDNGMQQLPRPLNKNVHFAEDSFA